MQTSPTAAAGQPAPHCSPFTAAIGRLLQPACHVRLECNDRVSYLTTDGAYVQLWARGPWDARRYQVLVGADCNTDTLAVVDDFGDLVVTHRRDPASPCGMTMRAVS